WQGHTWEYIADFFGNAEPSDESPYWQDLGACGTTTPTDPKDLTPPAVIGITPKQGSTSVDLAPTIQVTFSKPIAHWGGSVSAIQRGGTAIAVAGEWALDQNKTRLTFTPASQLAPGVEHVVRLYDATGNEIAESRFVTRPIARAGAKAEAQAAEDAMFTTCWANEAKARDPKTDGYLIGRHNWCAIQQVVRGDVEVGGKQVIKDHGLKADATIVGYANGNQTGAFRSAEFRVSLKNVTPVGLVFRQKAYIEIGAAVDQGATCWVTGPSVQGKWDEWQNGKTATFTVQSDEKLGQGVDKWQHCHPKFKAKIWLPDIPSTPVREYWSDAKPQVRCDSSRKLTRYYGKGCVFDKAVPVYRTTETKPGLPWDHSTDPDNVNMAYRSVPAHIWTALHRPDLTRPKLSGKLIPGHEIGGPPLRRNMNKDWKRKNNEKSRNICRMLFPDYDRKDAELGDKRYHKVYQCDEFPFQSTMEGSWVSVERLNTPDRYLYSVRPVWHKSNFDDGVMLGVFYGNNRVIGEDGGNRKDALDVFYVEAYVPGQNPHGR
ncbi:Ig-like domain-containing protein, partial [Nonomuraea sp. NPDC055795]